MPNMRLRTSAVKRRASVVMSSRAASSVSPGPSAERKQILDHLAGDRLGFQDLAHHPRVVFGEDLESSLQKFQVRFWVLDFLELGHALFVFDAGRLELPDL